MNGIDERNTIGRSLIATVCLAIMFVSTLGDTTFLAQSFQSGSDGSDGDLVLAANLGPVLFDPQESLRWGRVLDADGDGVYNFGTVSIGAGTTLQFRGDKVNRPIYWLASGNVVINGTLDLSGATGGNISTLSNRRQVALPGSGGFAGGAGGVANAPSTPGEGPGGGLIDLGCGFNSPVANTGTFSGNRYLIPLIGGSGGAGLGGAGGGAGGGAILIASSTSIGSTPNTGAILARGGNGGTASNSTGAYGGPGSGGAIRLVAPVITGPFTLDVRGGTSTCSNGSPGFVRVEAFTIGSLSFPAGSTATTTASPVPGTVKPQSSIRITAIDGQSVPTNPSGSFSLPDVTISNGQPVAVSVEASGIPNGTVVTLQVYPQAPDDSAIVYLPTAQATLTGTLELSTATATFTFPFGFSRGYLRATWTQ